MGVPPTWCRLIGYAIAAALLAALGLKWGVIVALPLMAAYTLWHKRRFGHWP